MSQHPIAAARSTSGPASTAVAERRDATDEEARALASSLRLRILRICLHDAHTNKEVAEVLGRDPASTLHHVRRLVDTGFLVAEPARRGTRGSREIPYRATGKSWQINTPGTDNALLDAFVEEVALVPIESVQTMRMGFRLTAEELDEFGNRLRDLVDEFRVRSDAGPDGRAVSMFVAMHPDPNSPA